jgi:signal peptide peptidase SppA
MKSYPQIFSKVYEQPWLITPVQHRAIRRQLEAHIAGVTPAPEDGDGDEPPGMSIDGSTAIIPVHGVIGKHLSMLETLCGGVDCDTVAAMLDAAVGEDSVKSILLDFRSPGGTVTGVPELARKIQNCPKPTMAFTDSQCCSGALWLAMACQSFYCTESADVGSVGVYSVYLDESAALAMEGIKVNAITAGKFKMTGASFKPMTDEEKTMLQEGVDKIYNQFKEAVTLNRQIADENLQGQVFDGEDACKIGFCDGLVDDITELLD